MPDIQNAPNMQYDPNMPYQEEEKEKRRGAGFYIGIIIAILAIVAAVAIGIYMFMGSTQYTGGVLGQLDGKSDAEIQAELDRYVEEGMLNISIASYIEFENGTSEGEVKIENSPANRYNMQVEIALQDTGEVIYTSDVLQPNYHIQFAQLDENLPAGEYPCLATFYAIDPDTGETIGQAAAAVTVGILN